MIYSIIVFHNESELQFLIGLRTASLERQSKTELLNIREQLRLEKKRVQKEINDVDEKVTRIEQDQTHFVQDIKREKLKESSKYSVELQRNQSAIRESENKVCFKGFHHFAPVFTMEMNRKYKLYYLDPCYQ